jgi:L-aminopeptidase/D-esterase-like protein
MTCFGFPGGIGTASRVVGDVVIGVLLRCNFGDRELLANRRALVRSRARPELSSFFAAAYEAVWEAVYSCLVAGRPHERRDGSMQERFPLDRL